MVHNRQQVRPLSCFIYLSFSLTDTGPPLSQEELSSPWSKPDNLVSYKEMEEALEKGEAILSARKKEWMNKLRVSHADLRYDYIQTMYFRNIFIVAF